MSELQGPDIAVQMEEVKVKSGEVQTQKSTQVQKQSICIWLLATSGVHRCDSLI